MVEDGERLEIDVTRLAAEGERLEGEVDIVDIDEEFVKPFGGVRYSLDARLYGNELLVKGRLAQDFTLVCSRCGKDFDSTVEVDDFVTSVEVGENAQTVDLTQEARESIILNLPAYPVCSGDCPGIERKAEIPEDGRWKALDGFTVDNAGKAGRNSKNGKS